ncbi:MAG TPA: efflux RND transporter periplasmic adaptor subunit [Puia sp.]|nr:efflux RND transporter periplasmic adaptor subunit [Puia sp.]
MKPLLISITIFFCLFHFISCKDKTAENVQLIPEVSVVEAGQKTVPVFAEYVGQTYGQSDIEIRPRAEGWIRSVDFKEGSPVKQGQLLYTIQDDEARDRVEAAQARLSEAKVLLVKAKSDLDRVKPLVEMNALSQRDLDAAQASYDAQQQAVYSAQALVHNAETQLSYTKIISPVTGYIGISKVQVGDYVSKGAGQQAINTISSLGSMRVRFAIPESDYIKYKEKINPAQVRNTEVQFILNDGSIFPETGKLDFTNREIDPSTGSLLVQATVENKTHLLRPGQYLKVRFKSDEIPNAVLVPQQAINQLQNIFMAYLVNDSNQINPKPVKAGIRIGSNWVINSGLKPGEKVALIGNIIIKPGMTIKPAMIPYSYDSTSTAK